MVNFNFISSFVLQQKSKSQFFWPKIVHDFLSKTLMLSQQSAFTASLKDIPWYIYLVIFSLAIIAGHSSATGLAYLNLTLCARKELWVIHSYCERRTLPIPSSEIFWVTQSYQRTIVSIVLFTSQNLAKMSLVGSGNWP